MADDLAPPDTDKTESARAGDQPYAVFARKYRPQSFDDLVGQEALVRTLTNAINGGRLHHAFVLTGVRGVGKTTTARIVARALNCIGPDGTGGPTPRPCGECPNCVAIAQDRHVDVIEIDAASRTGIDDVREIIDGVRYAPVQARFKVYIVDEVHMFSKQAFNGLLKTLEEPPPHVKFIFATTEIRKVPITVLSRCQRFDLRRLDMAELQGLLRRVLEAEAVKGDEEAVTLIARAADGSARDGLSLLDQAVAQGGGVVEADSVRAMLGLADRTVVLDLFKAIITGASGEAMAVLDRLHRAGAEPLVVLQDLLDLTHFLTRAKLVPEVLDDPTVPEAERLQGRELLGQLTVPVLTRAWQMMLKGVGEVQNAPLPAQALEMVVIRLIYAGMLPTPGDLARMVEGGAAGGANGGATGGATGGASATTGGGDQGGQTPTPASGSGHSPETRGAAPTNAVAHGQGTPHAQASGRGSGRRGGAALSMVASQADVDRQAHPQEQPGQEQLQAQPSQAPPHLVPDGTPAADQAPQSFAELAALFERRADGYLHHYFYAEVHPVKVAAGYLEFRPGANAPTDLAARMARALEDWTGQRWTVAVSNEAGGPSLKEQESQEREAARDRALNHPVVKAVLSGFPGASLEGVASIAAEAPVVADEPPATSEEADLDRIAGGDEIGDDDEFSDI